jgi:predicted nuclease with TOPRIM domain
MEKTAREVIKDTIGISVDAGDITPMDYGECATLHSSQLKEELSALREENERLRTDLLNANSYVDQLQDENKRLNRRLNTDGFVLRNCRSYLEMYQDDWKEGEQSLYALNVWVIIDVVNLEPIISKPRYRMLSMGFITTSYIYQNHLSTFLCRLFQNNNIHGYN